MKCFSIALATFVAGLTLSLSAPRCSAQESLVQFRLATVDTLGNPIASIDANQTFFLQAYVLDLRTLNNDGVFAAYMDVTHEAGLAALIGDIEHSPLFAVGASGTGLPGHLDEVGAIWGSLTPSGPEERLLFRVPFQAGPAGETIHFATNPADVVPQHNTLLYGDVGAIPIEAIIFGTADLAIVPEPSGAALCLLGAVALVASRLRRRRQQQPQPI